MVNTNMSYEKSKVFLATISSVYDDWAPYAAACLISHCMKNEYIKNKVDEEVYDTYINNFDELKESSQKELIFYSREYDNKKTRAVLNENKGSIKRYFGIDVSDEVAKGDFSKLTEEQLMDYDGSGGQHLFGHELVITDMEPPFVGDEGYGTDTMTIKYLPDHYETYYTPNNPDAPTMAVSSWKVESVGMTTKGAKKKKIDV